MAKINDCYILSTFIDMKSLVKIVNRFINSIDNSDYSLSAKDKLLEKVETYKELITYSKYVNSSCDDDIKLRYIITLYFALKNDLFANTSTIKAFIDSCDNLNLVEYWKQKKVR